MDKVGPSTSAFAMKFIVSPLVGKSTFDILSIQACTWCNSKTLDLCILHYGRKTYFLVTMLLVHTTPVGRHPPHLLKGKEGGK